MKQPQGLKYKGHENETGLKEQAVGTKRLVLEN